jgi:hypothetical protein
MPSRISNLRTALARSWFTLALCVLLLIAVPGFVLFLLNLFGKETSVNSWLQGTFNLSYHVPIPAGAMWLLLAVPVAILLLYFLKLKRKPLSVPSTFLWRKSIEDLHVNALFQWLRENVLLLLQLLAVLAILYGVMAFHLHGRSGEGKHYILMLDNSASMSATDVAPNRLAQAKQDALRVIDSYTDNDFGMLIVFNSAAEIRQSYTANRGELRRAVERVEPTQRPTRIEEALTLADSLANPVRSTEDVASRPADEVPGKERSYVPPQGIAAEVHLFSDGRFPDLSEAVLSALNSRAAGNTSALGNLHLTYHLAGNPGPENVDNVGIVVFTATRDDRDPQLVHVLVRVQNFRPNPTTAHVELEVHVGGKLKTLLPARAVTMPARKVTEEQQEGKEGKVVNDQPGEGSVTFDLTDLDEETNAVLHCRLADVQDKFALDNEAWLVVGVIRKAHVLIVGPSNPVLDAFFDDDATRKVARVDRLGPADLDKPAYQQPARGAAYDLVIFDRCAPTREEDMPRANTFFIGEPPPPFKAADTEKLTYPPVVGWQTRNTLLRYLAALYEIGIKDAFKLKNLPPRTPKLIESEHDVPLMFSLTRGAFTDLVLAFSIIDAGGAYNTDWPGKPSFPLFLQNLVHVLGNVRDAATEDTCQPGQVRYLRPDDPVQRVTVTGPDQKAHVLVHDDKDQRPDFVFGSTDEVGPYEVRWGQAARRYFAVNLLDGKESNIEPAPVIQIGGEQVVAGQELGQPREVWKWFAVAALVLLLGEWYIYNRRVYV